MIIHFTKKIVTGYHVGQFDAADGSLYSVLVNNKTVGEILISKKKSYIIIFDENYFIEDNKIFSTKSPGQQVAQFKLSDWSFFIGYVDKLVVGKKRFLFKRIKIGARWPFFNAKGRGQFKFRLSGTMEYINYSFKLNIPAFSFGNPYTRKEFSGKIELNESDFLPAIFAMFLVERHLKIDAI